MKISQVIKITRSFRFERLCVFIAARVGGRDPVRFFLFIYLFILVNLNLCDARAQLAPDLYYPIRTARALDREYSEGF